MLDEPDAYRKNGRVYRHLMNSNMPTIICLHVYSIYLEFYFILRCSCNLILNENYEFCIKPYLLIIEDVSRKIRIKFFN